MIKTNKLINKPINKINDCKIEKYELATTIVISSSYYPSAYKPI